MEPQKRITSVSVIENDKTRTQVVKIHLTRIIEETDVQKLKEEFSGYLSEKPESPDYDSNSDYCLNLEEVVRASSNFFGLLLNLNKQHQTLRKKPLSLIKAQPEVYKALEITRINHLLNVYNTLEDYLASR